MISLGLAVPPSHRLAALALPILFGLAAVSVVGAQEKIPVEGTDRYQVRYANGAVSINDTCPVLKRGLGVRKRPVWVNGEPVGFC